MPDKLTYGGRRRRADLIVSSSLRPLSTLLGQRDRTGLCPLSGEPTKASTTKCSMTCAGVKFQTETYQRLLGLEVYTRPKLDFGHYAA